MALSMSLNFKRTQQNPSMLGVNSLRLCKSKQESKFWSAEGVERCSKHGLTCPGGLGGPEILSCHPNLNRNVGEVLGHPCTTEFVVLSALVSEPMPLEHPPDSPPFYWCLQKDTSLKPQFLISKAEVILYTLSGSYCEIKR